MEGTKTWRGRTIASIGFTGLVLGAVLIIGRNVQRGGAVSASDQITVTVTGEISKPGPVRLPKGSTVEYLLLQVRPKSTALLEGIDVSRVLVDGEKVTIPRRAKSASRSSQSRLEVLDALWIKELSKGDPDLIASMLGVEKGLAAEISRLVKDRPQGKGSIRWADEILTHPNVLQERWQYPKWVNTARNYAEARLLKPKGSTAE